MVHKLKKKVRYYEWAMNDVDIRHAWKTENELALNQLKLKELKRTKKDLKGGKELTFSEMMV